jgi:hypothetical protein
MIPDTSNNSIHTLVDPMEVHMFSNNDLMDPTMVQSTIRIHTTVVTAAADTHPMDTRIVPDIVLLRDQGMDLLNNSKVDLGPTWRHRLLCAVILDDQVEDLLHLGLR